MAKRSPIQQSKHNKGVDQSATYYDGLGYKVQADLPGYDKPKTIEGRRPDLIASKGKETVLVEVETPESLEKDARQQQVFKNYAERHKNVRFWRKLVK